MFGRGKYAPFLIKCTVLALTLLVLGVLVRIVDQYVYYFPADFENSSFLVGRQAFFHGAYRVSFYAHIVCGPFTILLAMFLLVSGQLGSRLSCHRFLGKIQFALILILAPSGLIMSTRSYTGWFAGVGFGLLSIFTVTTAVMSVRSIRRGNVEVHRLWSQRLFLLLMSPIALRLASGLAIVANIESETTYRISAWASWLVPLIAFEVWQHSFKSTAPTQTQLPLVHNRSPQT